MGPPRPSLQEPSEACRPTERQKDRRDSRGRPRGRRRARGQGPGRAGAHQLECGRSGAGRAPRRSSANGLPPWAPWGLFIRLPPAAPQPRAGRGGGPAGPAPGGRGVRGRPARPSARRPASGHGPGGGGAQPQPAGPGSPGGGSRRGGGSGVPGKGRRGACGCFAGRAAAASGVPLPGTVPSFAERGSDAHLESQSVSPAECQGPRHSALRAGAPGCHRGRIPRARFLRTMWTLFRRSSGLSSERSRWRGAAVPYCRNTRVPPKFTVLNTAPRPLCETPRCPLYSWEH